MYQKNARPESEAIRLSQNIIHTEGEEENPKKGALWEKQLDDGLI
jgi:hypothetical protein